MEIEDERFARGPIGSWGASPAPMIGISLTFAEDGRGELDEWGFDHHHVPDARIPGRTFKWNLISPRHLRILHDGEAFEIEYEFRKRLNEYRNEELILIEAGKESDEFGEIGFWVSPFSLVYTEEPETQGSDDDEIEF